MTTDKPKTRFAPSPTGHLHVGSARTALFDYLLARRTGGTFLLRIEDTDRERHVPEAVEQIQEDLRWLGLTWDEGVGVGGPNGPYVQSERLEAYRRHARQLLDAGKAYYAFETPEELEGLRDRAMADKTAFRYARPATLPTQADADRAAAEGRPVTVRFRCPGHDVTIHDEVFGDVTIPVEQQEDFIIVKSDGFPTYHLANVVDDALMGVTFVLRGQEFLGQTWRQKLLREAFGWPEPRYAHLPLILDMQGKKLSKREGSVDVYSFRREGYLPEAMVNFIALLGWSPGTDREKFTLAELEQAFSVERLGNSNAKFDREKLLAFNTDIAAAMDEDALLARFRDFLAINDTPIPQGDEGLLRHLLRVNRGFRTFQDIVAKCGILFAPDAAVAYDPEAVKKVLDKGDGQGWQALRDLRPLLAEATWTAEALEAMLKGFCERTGLGMGKVAQPLRVAITGTTISPPIYDSLVLLGREHTLARIDTCLVRRP